MLYNTLRQCYKLHFKKIISLLEFCIKTYNPERSYSGRVISEDETSITIIDIYGHHVRILLNNASIVQEEKERN